MKETITIGNRVYEYPVIDACLKMVFATYLIKEQGLPTEHAVTMVGILAEDVHCLKDVENLAKEFGITLEMVDDIIPDIVFNGLNEQLTQVRREKKHKLN